MACVKMWEYDNGRLYYNCRHVLITDGTTNPLEAEYLAQWLDDNQPKVKSSFADMLFGLSSDQAFYVLLRSVNRNYPNWNSAFIVSDRPMFNNATKAAFQGLSSWMDD